jgi:hypothetical protein
MLLRVILVRADISEKLLTSIVRMIRIGQLGTTSAVTCICTAYFSYWLLLTSFLARRFLSPWWRSRYVSPNRRFLQELHGVIFQKTVILYDYRWTTAVLLLQETEVPFPFTSPRSQSDPPTFLSYGYPISSLVSKEVTGWIFHFRLVSRLMMFLTSLQSLHGSIFSVRGLFNGTVHYIGQQHAMMERLNAYKMERA